jgi:pyridoxamine 5'-phosphate oxidase
MSTNQTLENLRVSYSDETFDISDCQVDPMAQFDKWLEHAIETKCDEPNAFVLSTIEDNKPHARVVLLKGFHQKEFVFYTNYQSAKASNIATNTNVAMTFLWLPLQRQVRVEGTISKVSDDISEDYFHKRPRGSQLGAIASPQSSKVSGREELEKLFRDAEAKYEGLEKLPRPAHWGGYRINPTYIEFWQGRNNRLHDRICCARKGSSWELHRLAP